MPEPTPSQLVPQDSPTGMRLYRVEEVESFKNEIAHLWTVINQLNGTAEANDKAFSDLAEQLRQEQAAYKQMTEGVNMMNKIIESLYRDKSELLKIISALELRLRLKDSPIKAGLKRIWKWFKGLVGK